MKWSIYLLGLLCFFILVVPVGAVDLRPRRLARFLAGQKSPLAFFAQDFVAEADRNFLDYRLLVSISGVESTFGRNHILGTYNVYGWGKGTIPFQSWPDGIAKVSAGLKTGYLDKGAISVAQIAPIYDPPGSRNWAAGVSQFMAEIEQSL